MEDYAFSTVRHDRFNHYKSVHVLFYSQNKNGVFHYLLIKKATELHYHEPTDEITELDSTPVFTASRVMISELRGALSSNNIQKIIENKKLVEEDLVPSDMEFHKVLEHPVFFEGVKKILESPCAVDSIKGKLVLLLDIPYIGLERINKLLNKNGKGVSLKWFSNQALKTSKEVAPWLKYMANFFDIPAHIEFSLSWEQENYSQADTYIVLSCKPVNDQNSVDPLYLHFPALFQGFFKRSRERWLHFNAARGEFPSEEEMKTVRAVIIPGSSVSVYDRHEGITKLKEWIREFDRKYPKVKMLGICFGAQIITSAFGGEVQKMRQRKEDPSYYYLGTEKLQVDEDFFSLSFTKKSQVSYEQNLCIVEAHGDEITKLPKSFKNFGSSKLCKNELIVSEDSRYLAFQGHPEYDADYIAARCAITAISTNTEDDHELEAIIRYKDEMLARSFSDQATNKSLRKICYSFLKLGTEIGSP